MKLTIILSISVLLLVLQTAEGASLGHEKEGIDQSSDRIKEAELWKKLFAILKEFFETLENHANEGTSPSTIFTTTSFG